MIKKLTSILLCLLTLSGVFVPALAAEDDMDIPAADEAILAPAEDIEPRDDVTAPDQAPEELPAEVPQTPEAGLESDDDALSAEPEQPEPVICEEYSQIVYESEGVSPRSAQAGSASGARAAGYTYDDFTPRALNGETLRRGVDVSSWQYTIDWNAVAAAGVEFAIIRAAYRGATSGTLATDSYFKANVTGAKAAGLKVGVYIFSQATTVAEAEEEAEYLMKTAQGYSMDLPFVLDFEFYSGGRLEKAKLSRREATDICIAFRDRIERAGYASMVYANPSMLNNNLYAAELGRLWLAHYTQQTGYSGAPYEYWQCSSSGAVNGIKGDVDLDFWFEPDIPFLDVKQGAWYYDDVAKAYKKGIVAGMRADLFDPNGTATRGQFVTMLYRMVGSPAGSPEAGFTDLIQGYYKNAVNWAAANNITSGYSETVFGPERNITREELVTLLYRMEGMPEPTTDLSAYADADKVQNYARPAMAWAVENKIVAGYEDQTLRPQANARRAEVCAFLMRCLALDHPE